VGNKYKRPFDLGIIVFAHTFPPTLLVWLVIWVVIPLLIWLEDRGRVFFRQERVGLDGKVFSVWKFRTMVHNADVLGQAWTREGDERVTRVGRLLRRTGLDELPQLLNVIKGEMSLVGPRPLAVEEQELLENQIAHFCERLQVLPGLTGLAQLYNRDDDSEEKLKYDIIYIKDMSWRLDLRLLFLTAVDVILRRRDVRTGKPLSQ
jgi:lipopolysaccharide/colanic/teichoic acid biosynthesis glycosyltransferase